MIRQVTMQIQFENPQSSMSFRMALARKSFSLHTSETSSSTVVTDTIRKIDYENAWQALRHSYKFNRCHWAAEADLVTVRLLPEAVGTFCLQHTSGETYHHFLVAALRWKQQQRSLQNSNPRNSCTSWGVSLASDANGEWNLDAVGNSGHRCTKCGSRKHGAKHV